MREESPSRGLALLALLLVALVLAPSAGAAPTFLAPVTLSAAGENASDPELAFSSSRAIFGWAGTPPGAPTGLLMARERLPGPGRPFQPLAPISPAGEDVEEVDVGIAPGGGIVAVWAADGQVRFAEQRSDGSFAAPVTVSVPVVDEGAEPSLAVDGSGNIAVAYTSDTGIRLAERAAGALTFGVPSTISTGEEAVEPSAAFSPGGALAVAWTDDDNSEIELFQRPPGGVVQRRTVSPASDQAGEPDVAFDPAGVPAVAWSDLSPSTPDADKGRIRLARTPGAGPGTISDAGDASASQPRLAFGPSGAVAAVWIDSDSEDRGRTRHALETRAGAGVFSRSTISGADLNTSEPRIGFDARGEGAVAWIDLDADDNGRVRVRPYDAAGPVLDATIPPRGEVGTPVRFSATATDFWTASTLSWSFGDGTTARGGAPTHVFTAAGTYPVAVTATDASGNASRTTGSISVVLGPGGDRLAPIVSDASLSRRRFAVGRGPTPTSARIPRGTTIGFGLSERGRVSIDIERLRIRTGRCIRGGGRRCFIWRRSGTLRRRGLLGRNSVPFTGRIGRRPLAAGSYRATVRATDSAGNTSAPARLRFRVLGVRSARRPVIRRAPSLTG